MTRRRDTPSPDDPSDPDLMLNARDGDLEAFAVIVRRHQARLLNFYVRLGVSNDGEDLVQQCFLRLYRRVATYQADAKFTTYLYRVARTVWIDWVRRQARRGDAMGRYEEEAAVTHFPRHGFWKVAAGIAVAAGGLWLAVSTLRPQSGPTGETLLTVASPVATAAARGRAWLAAVQEGDGAWDGAKWGGTGQHGVALTGLALLTLSQGDTTERESTYRDTIDRAVAYLLEQQGASGVFASGARDDRHAHAIATCALLEVYRQSPRIELKRALDAAIIHLATDAPAAAGWTYTTDGHTAKDPIAFPWRHLALDRAAALGWTAVTEAGADPADAAHAFARPSAARPDVQRWFFTARELAQADSPSAFEALERLRKTIVSRQLPDGPEAGSWGLTGRCSAVGGRVFTTALATLALST